MATRRRPPKATPEPPSGTTGPTVRDNPVEPTRPAEALSLPAPPSASPAWQDAFLAHYDALDATLVAHGFPATSPWWRSRIERFRFHLRARMPGVCSRYEHDAGQPCGAVAERFPFC